MLIPTDPWSRCVAAVSSVAGEMIADDYVVVEIDPRRWRRSKAVVVHRDARVPIANKSVVDHDVAGVRGPGPGSKNSHSRARSADPIARRGIVGNRVVGYAKRDCRSRSDRDGRRMRGHGDAAVVHIVLDDIAADEIAAIDAGLIGDENSAGVVLYGVSNYRGVLVRHQVDALAAVISFAGFKGRQAGAGAAGERLVVVDDIDCLSG